MKALLVPIGSYGDVHPYVGLAIKLRERGHEPILIANGHYQGLADREGIPLVPTVTGDDYHQHYSALQTDSPLQTFRRGAQRLHERTRSVYQAIRDNMTAGETIVAAPVWALGARIAHDKLRVPLVSMLSQPQVLRSVHRSAFLPDRMPKLIKRMIFRTFDGAVDAVLKKQTNLFRGELGLPPVHRLFDKWWYSPQQNIGMFPDWFFPPQPDWPPHVDLVGFSNYDRSDEQPPSEELLAYLSEGDAPLVFVQASWMQKSHNFFEVSAQVAQQLDRRAIVLSPHADQIPQDLPARIKHFDYVPYTYLLPRAALLVHSGGIGTVAQSIAAGVPQIVMPTGLDQPDNGNIVQRLGLGQVISKKKYQVDIVARTIDAVLGSQDVQANCQRYRDLSRSNDAIHRSCELMERTLFAAAQPAVAP